jgi:tetratricopeptide (TPR) repeat protein
LEARALINSDLAKSREAGKRAIAKAMVQGAHVLVADTEATLCQQAVGAGVGEAASECEAARQTSVAVGDHNGAAMALNNLAAIYYQAGDLVRAEKEFLQVLEEFQKIGNLDGVATAMSNLGGVLQSLGDPRRARKYLEESIPNYEAVEDHEGVALALNNLGDLARQSGELEAARINYQRAMETARQYGEKNAQAYVLSGLGDVLYDRGELAEAKKSYETALELRTQLGEPQYMAESRVSLALVAIEEQYAADAEVTLRKCEQEFHEAHEADDELSAAVDLSSALLAQGKNSEAQQQIQSIRELAGRSQNRLARLQYALAAARAVLASEHPEQARGMLTKILRDVRETGFAGMELQVRLAQAELEKRTGRAAEGKAQYAAVENEARARGFGLIAKKAQQG